MSTMNTSEKVDRLTSLLWVKVHELVEKELKDIPIDIADEVRQRLTEQFRFWRRAD